MPTDSHKAFDRIRRRPLRSSIGFLCFAVCFAAAFVVWRETGSAQTPAQAPAPVRTATQSTSPEDVAAAQATAEQTEKDWLAQAQVLDSKLAPLLPCDATARKAIQDVSRASDARITALSGYLRLAAARAAEQSQNARRLLESEEARAP